MKLLVLRINNETYVPTRLKEEAKKRGGKLDVVNYQELLCQFNHDLKLTVFNKSKLESYDAFIFRSAGTPSGTYLPFRDNLIRYFTQDCRVCLNGESYLQIPRLDKLTQHYLLSQNSLPVVKTLIFGKHVPLQEVEERLSAELDFPILVKPKIGSQGKNIYLVKKSGLSQKLKDLQSQTYLDLSFWLFQQYLPTRIDYRIIVVGNEVVGGMKRIAAEGSFITNFSQGGKIEPAKLDKRKKELALNAARIFKLDFAGVDIMEDKQGKNYILEVNRACWFRGFEAATSLNVAAKIINFIFSRIES